MMQSYIFRDIATVHTILWHERLNEQYLAYRRLYYHTFMYRYIARSKLANQVIILDLI